jgi:hypothetical protein
MKVTKPQRIRHMHLLEKIKELHPDWKKGVGKQHVFIDGPASGSEGSEFALVERLIRQSARQYLD